MKRFLTAFYIFACIFSTAIAMVPQRALADDPTSETDLRRRELHTFAECLQNYITSDSGGTISTYNGLFTGGAAENQLIVVGFERSSDGTKTCVQTVREGIVALQPGPTSNGTTTGDGSDNSSNFPALDNWFLNRLTGTDFNKSPGGISRGPIQGNRKALLAQVQQAESALNPPQNGYLQSRVWGSTYSLPSICYTFKPTGSLTGALGPHDFALPAGVGGYAIAKSTDDVRNAIAPYLTNATSSAFAVHVKDGGLDLGFFWKSPTGIASFDPYSSHFFPIGTDVSQTQTDSKFNAIVNCQWVKDNAGLVFNGYTFDGSGNLQNPAGVPAVPKTPSQTPGANTKCDVGNFSWFWCPVIAAVDGVASVIQDAIKSLLYVNPLSSGLKTIMDRFITLADVGFVLIFLIVIASNTLSIGLSNYSIKKMLPRLVVAVVAIQFSFVIVQFLIDVCNVLGAGVSGLITVAVGTGKASSDGILTQTLGLAELGVATGGAIVLVGPELIVPLILGVLAFLVTIVTVFLTLFIRAIILQLLAIVAPLALLAWVLPNTEDYFKKWWKALTRLLLMYPMIMALFAIGWVVKSLPSTIGGASNNTFVKIFSNLAPIFVLFMVPATWKWAGGAMAAAGSFVAKQGSKASGAATKKAKTDAKALGKEKLNNLRAGGGIKVLGRKTPLLSATKADGTSSRLGGFVAGAARIGSFSSGTAATKAFLGNSKKASEEMQLEGYTLDDHHMMLGGQAYFKKEFDEINADKTLTDEDKQKKIEALAASRAKTKKHWGDTARAAASIQALTAAGQVDDDLRKNIEQSFGTKGVSGNIGRKLWSDAAGSASKKDSSLMFTSVDGVYNHQEHLKWLRKQEQGTLASQKGSVWEKALGTPGSTEAAQNLAFVGGETALRPLLEGPGARASAEAQVELVKYVSRSTPTSTPPPSSPSSTPPPSASPPSGSLPSAPYGGFT